MSDSDDDFMSDKFLVDAPTEPTTYTARRQKTLLRGRQWAQASQQRPAWEIEAERRREGLSRSLFDSGSVNDGTGTGSDAVRGEGAGRGGIGSSTSSSGPPPSSTGQTKAMDLMMKMGWKVGEGLGRRRSASPERAAAPTAVDREHARAGIGSGVGPSAPKPKARAEPIRISMWAGRKGLTARSPSPPPLRRDPHSLAPERVAELGQKADRFRATAGADHAARDASRKAAKARALLVELDEKKGVKFHPLHIDPLVPQALPRPLLVRIYPDQASPSRSRSPSPVTEAVPVVRSANSLAASRANLSAAERLREQMRRDMLSELGRDDGEDTGEVRFGVLGGDKKGEGKGEWEGEEEEALGEAEVDWDEMVSGTKRVLTMTPAENLAFVVSQLRHEHLFCFWCGSQYASWDEMDGFGGCPGEDEDDH